MRGEVPSRVVRVLLGGGIGAGKTAVGEIFASRGFDVVVADTVGHDVLATDDAAMAAVLGRWPSVEVDGRIDRRRLADIVFRDVAELGELEAIVHPRIAERIAERMASATPPGVVVEVPVTSVVDDRDATRVAVVASRDTRFARAVARGGDPDDVERRIEAQDTDAVWRTWADHVIENDGNWAETERAVEELIERMVADG
jgi:dephospho-CoA kinase